MTDVCFVAMVIWRRCFRMALLMVCGASLAQAQIPALTVYQQAMQSMLDDTVMPRLKANLAAGERSRVFDLTLTVTGDSDPGEVLIQNGSRPSRHLTSAGYLSLQDVLIDATIVAELESLHIDELMDYSFEVARYGYAITRPDTPAMAVPRPFWERLNWSQSKYQQLRNARAYNVTRYSAAQQNLAWLGAVAITLQVSTADAKPERYPSLMRRREVYERAGDLMLRSNWAPAPAWPVAILYAAMKNKDEPIAPEAWACEAAQILEASAAAVQRTDSQLSDSERRAERQRMNEYWQVIVSKLAERGQCDSSTQRSFVEHEAVKLLVVANGLRAGRIG